MCELKRLVDPLSRECHTLHVNMESGPNQTTGQTFLSRNQAIRPLTNEPPVEPSHHQDSQRSLRTAINRYLRRAKLIILQTSTLAVIAVIDTIVLSKDAAQVTGGRLLKSVCKQVLRDVRDGGEVYDGFGVRTCRKSMVLAYAQPSYRLQLAHLRGIVSACERWRQITPRFVLLHRRRRAFIHINGIY